MAHTKPILLPPIRGEEPYDRWLDALAARAGAPGRTQLVEAALAHLAASLGLPPPPRRMRPRGTNRFGEPKSADASGS